MRIFLVLIFSCFVLFSCNDGDVISVELDFDKSLTLCGDETTSNYILYDTKTTPFESLMLFSSEFVIQKALLKGRSFFFHSFDNYL